MGHGSCAADVGLSGGLPFEMGGRGRMVVYNDDPKTMEKHCITLILNYYSWGGSGGSGMQLSHERNLQFPLFKWPCCELARNRPMLVRCDACWSDCFTVTVSAPETLDEIENVSAINKGNHNKMTKQWTPNGGQRVSSLYNIYIIYKLYHTIWLKDLKTEVFSHQF